MKGRRDRGMKEVGRMKGRRDRGRGRGKESRLYIHSYNTWCFPSSQGQAQLHTKNTGDSTNMAVLSPKGHREATHLPAWGHREAPFPGGIREATHLPSLGAQGGNPPPFPGGIGRRPTSLPWGHREAT